MAMRSLVDKLKFLPGGMRGSGAALPKGSQNLNSPTKPLRQRAAEAWERKSYKIVTYAIAAALFGSTLFIVGDVVYGVRYANKQRVARRCGEPKA